MSFIQSLGLRIGSALVLLAALLVSLPTAAQFLTPFASGLHTALGIKTDAAGNVYVADLEANKVLKISASGTVTVVAGTGDSGYFGDGGPATSAWLNFPYDIALDAAGNLFIADTLNRRVRRVDAVTGIITTVAGNGSLGSAGDGMAATSAQLNQPHGLAFDAAGDLYIADYGSNRIRRISGGIITAFAGNGTFAFSGDGGPAIDATFQRPEKIAVDPDGNVYIVDSLNSRVRRVTPGGVISTVAGNGNQAGAVVTGASATQTPMLPANVAFANGALYIADQGNNLVLRVKDGLVGRVAGGGSGGNGSLPTQAALASPVGVAIAPDDTLYVMELEFNGSGYDSRIRKVSPVPTPPGAPTGVSAVAMVGGATISFTAPADGGAPIETYRLTCTGPSGTASLDFAASPVSFPLPYDGSYTCTVAARNAVGYGVAASAPSVAAQLPILSVTKNGSGSGFVAASPDGLTCGTLCSFPYAAGTPVTLTATPTTGSTFAGWSGDCTGTGTCTITMDGSRSVTATFTFIPVAQSITFDPIADRALNQSPFNVSAVASSGLTVSFSSQTASTCSVSGNAVTLLSTGTCTIRASQAGNEFWQPAFVERSFTVNAALVTLNVAIDGNSGSGTVTSNPSGINCGGDCSEAYAPGMSITLTAQYAPYYRFTAWSGVACDGGVQTNKTCTFTLAANTTATASFANPPLRGNPGDLDGDDDADLVWTHADGRIATWLMDGLTKVSASVVMGAGTGWSVTHVADFDGDGRSDLLFRNTDGRAAIWLMQGNTLLDAREIMGAGAGWQVLRVADLDNDGKADIVWQHTDGRVAAWLMNGLVPSAVTELLGPGTGWSVTHIGDFDGNGRADLLWRNADGRVAVWLMEGLVPLQAVEIFGAGSGWSVAHVADLDGDGKSDLVWQHADGSVVAWLMNGTAQASAATLLGPGAWSVVGTADVNGDGKSDLIWSNTDGAKAIWLMDGLSASATAIVLAPGTGWSFVRKADLNADFIDDLVWHHTDGTTIAWLMNGLTFSNSAVLFGAGSAWNVSTAAQ